MLAGNNPSIPSDWTLDAAICKSLGSHALPLAQGEGLIVALMLGASLTKTSRSTWSRDTTLVTMHAFPSPRHMMDSFPSVCPHLSPTCQKRGQASAKLC